MELESSKSVPATQAVGAIVVTYHPDLSKLDGLLSSIRADVARLVLVDNTPASELQAALSLAELASRHQAELIVLGQNCGIAAAQNRGIAALSTMTSIEYVLFLDHDSLPAAGMVPALVNAFESQTRTGYRVGAVGPQITVPKTGSAIPFLQIRWYRTRRVACTSRAELIQTDHLISSGTLISKVVLQEVGSFREDLFIDYVDVEWYLRAVQKGYSLWGVCAAIMQHDLGDEPISVFGRTVFTHSPLRHYYLVRNAIALYRSPAIPLRWKWSDAIRLTKKSIFYMLFASPRWEHICMMAKGLRDGLAGEMGQFKQDA
jgi:rhamnosyltransferase